jgi:ParB family transcriptional regulator, chromosome partitioning protein
VESRGGTLMSTEKKSRLGRGLDALLGGAEDPEIALATVAAPSRSEVPIDSIEKNPFQPRKTFDDDDLSSLRESIRNHGVLQPVLVRQVGDRYQLIAGERRLRAAQAVGLPVIPVTVVNFNDQQSFEAALVENIQRADLNPIEKARGFSDYLARYEMTHDQLATRLGLGRATITNLVALLDLPAELQQAVRDGQLSVGHAKILKGITDPLRQLAVSKEIIARGLSVHATEAYIKQSAAEEKASSGGGGGGRSGPEKTAHVVGVEDELRQKLGMKVEIRVKGKDKGQFILSFESNDDFERIVELFRG